MVALASLPGCWSKQEPKEMSIFSSVIYDKKEDGTYRVICEFLKLSPTSEQGGGGANGEENGNVIEISEGSTIREAVSDVANTIEKKLYGGHNHARFFTERFARNGENVTAAIDFFLREKLTDETPQMIVIKGDHPEYIYGTSLELSDTVGMYVLLQKEALPKEVASSVYVSTLDFVKDSLEPGKEPVMGLIQIVEKEDLTSITQTQGSGESNQNASSGAQAVYRINCEGLAAFKGTEMVGFMDGTEALAYNIVTDQIKTDIVSVSLDGCDCSLKIESSQCSIKTRMDNEEAYLDASVKMTLDLTAESGNLDIEQVDVQKAIEQSFNRKMESLIYAAIHKAQKEFKSDIFGFGEQMHIQHPQDWKQLADTWNDTFSKATVAVTVDGIIVGTGQTDTSFGLKECQQ